jgi:hypothetical protein
LNRLFPSLERIDRARFPTPAQLESELGTAGFSAAEVMRLSQSGEISREVALEKIRGKHISTFDLIDDEEYERGLELAERELGDPIGYSLEWMIVVAAT